jgi:hypothetical protein
MRAVMADTTDVVIPDVVHEASIEDFQSKKLIMHEKPEPRDGMPKTKPKKIEMVKESEMRVLKLTPKGKYDKNGNMDLVMDEKPGGGRDRDA